MPLQQKKHYFFFDDLYDSFNGNKDQGLSSIITQNSGHFTFWQEALRKLRKMEFVERKRYKFLKRSKPKCLINWRQTIRGTQYLWKMLQTYGFTTLNLKYLNQDPIENLFSQIRNHGQQNNNPTPYLFGTSFKALLILPLLTLMRTEEIESSIKNEITVECEKAAIPDTSDTALYIDMNKIINSVKKKIRIDCAQCITILEDKKTIQMLEHAVEIAEKQFPNFCHETKVKCKLIETLNREALSTAYFHCNNVHNIVLDTLAHYFIIEWCNLINKILRRQIKYDSKKNYMYFQAHRMSLKYRKKGKFKN